jgi:hypothetical protein
MFSAPRRRLRVADQVLDQETSTWIAARRSSSVTAGGGSRR